MVAARIRTHILTTQPSEHKSDALNRSIMALHCDMTSAAKHMRMSQKCLHVITFLACSYYTLSQGNAPTRVTLLCSRERATGMPHWGPDQLPGIDLIALTSQIEGRPRAEVKEDS